MSLWRAIVLVPLVLAGGVVVGVGLGVAGAVEVVRDWWHDHSRRRS